MQPFESREIKGLNARSVFWLLSCTVSIMISVFTVYFNLKSQIQTLQLQKEGDARYNELRLKDIENKVDVNTIFIRELQTRLTELETKVMNIKIN